MSQQPSLDQFTPSINKIWSLIRETRVYDARELGCQLVENIESRLSQHQAILLPILAEACFSCGYAIAMNTRNKQVIACLSYYKRMEEVAHAIDDPTSLTIALTYQGDAYRRCGEMEKAFTHLQAAYDIFPRGDKAAHGNGAQLLGRVYLYLHDIANFERLLIEAEAIAHSVDPIENCVHGQYCLGTVYVEYARFYGKRGDLQKALRYLDQAEQALPPTPHWRALLLATRTDLLVRQGDVCQGLHLAKQLIALSYEHGNMRLLERVVELQHFLEHRAIEVSQAAASLNEALYGPFDH